MSKLKTPLISVLFLAIVVMVTSCASYFTAFVDHSDYPKQSKSYLFGRFNSEGSKNLILGLKLKDLNQKSRALDGRNYSSYYMINLNSSNPVDIIELQPGNYRIVEYAVTTLHDKSIKIRNKNIDLPFSLKPGKMYYIGRHYTFIEKHEPVDISLGIIRNKIRVSPVRNGYVQDLASLRKHFPHFATADASILTVIEAIDE